MSKYFWFTLLFLYMFQSFVNANPVKDDSLKYHLNALIEINHAKALQVAADLKNFKADIKTLKVKF